MSACSAAPSSRSPSSISYPGSSSGFDTAGWTRTAREVPGVVNFCGTSALEAFMQRCDIVVCVLPLTPDTQGILKMNVATSLLWPRIRSFFIRRFLNNNG
jgi:hypothetical protein